MIRRVIRHELLERLVRTRLALNLDRFVLILGTDQIAVRDLAKEGNLLI